MAVVRSCWSSLCCIYLYVLLFFIIVQQNGRGCMATKKCIRKDFGHGSIVCVCNSTYCDEIEKVEKVSVNQYVVYTSTKEGLRFHRELQPFTSNIVEDIGDVLITLLRNETFQTILGFGGAFTDAAGINVNGLSSNTRRHLLRSYFSENGIEYTVGRVPIGGCDFSSRPYTYDDGYREDFELAQFSLTSEDLNLKIPLIRDAMKLAHYPLVLLATPWSAPAWMKTNGQINGKGTLKGQPGGPYYSSWAKYFVRFLEEYSKHNITFWAVTAQNEPLNGNIANFTFNCLGFNVDLQRDFIAMDLGPTLDQYGFSDVKILILDDQRLMLPQWAEQVLANNSIASRYVAGIGFHWYLNFAVPPSVLTTTHELFPDKFILATEACEGTQPWDENKVLLGSWERGESYAHDIIQHWTIGWLDWNIALDINGGPNWANNNADSPVIVDSQNDQFFKQPMFYTLGHFSKFLLPGSVVIGLRNSETDAELDAVAAEGPQKSTIVVVMNRSENGRKLVIRDPYTPHRSIATDVPPSSIQTYIWWS